MTVGGSFQLSRILKKKKKSPDFLDMHFEDYPPKGIFWQNKMEFDFLALSGDSRPLVTFALHSSIRRFVLETNVF